MNHWMAIAFLATGIILVVLEMATLTFYLAALGFAALVTSLFAWFYPSEWWQAGVVYALSAVVALPIAHQLRRNLQTKSPDQLADMDKGGRVTVAENADGRLRVRYRDSLWEAVWEGAGEPRIGARAEVVAREGSRLRIKAIG